MPSLEHDWMKPQGMAVSADGRFKYEQGNCGPIFPRTPACTNIPTFIKFVRERHRPSFMEYGEYPLVSADEIKKALRVNQAWGDMLDQTQLSEESLR
jgi:hypothetical protein